MQVEAAARYGVPQVLYTFRESQQHPDDGEFEECGAMNLFFHLRRVGSKSVMMLCKLGRRCCCRATGGRA